MEDLVKETLKFIESYPGRFQHVLTYCISEDKKKVIDLASILDKILHENFGKERVDFLIAALLLTIAKLDSEAHLSISELNVDKGDRPK